MNRLALLWFLTSFITNVATAKTTQSTDLDLINKARLYFQSGKLQKAIDTYQKVSTSSEYWLEAKEELAHTYGRMGEYDKAISHLQPLMTSTFEGITGPEAYFVLALTHLKTCNYTEVLQTTKKYKEVFLEKLKYLKEIAKNATSQELRQLLEKAQQAKVSFELAGPLLKKLPRNLTRDRIAIKDKSQIGARAQDLSRKEIQEIEKILNKLQILEAEVVHRIHLFSDATSDRQKIGKIESGSDYLKFPTTDEIWIDELDSYSTEIEKCPKTKKRAAL